MLSASRSLYAPLDRRGKYQGNGDKRDEIAGKMFSFHRYILSIGRWLMPGRSVANGSKCI
jgi:hypothetical protein